MSTKIYEAYAAPATQIWKIIKYLKSEGVDSIRNNLIEIETNLLNSIDFDKNERYLLNLQQGCNEDNAKRYTVDHIMRFGFKEASVSSQTDFFDYSATVTIRKYRDRIYMIPYFGCGLKRDLSKTILSKYEDFSYWNNTDHPKEIPLYLWDYRGYIWNKIHNNWDSFTEVTLSSYESYWTVSPSSTRANIEIKKLLEVEEKGKKKSRKKME